MQTLNKQTLNSKSIIQNAKIRKVFKCFSDCKRHELRKINDNSLT